MSARKKIRLLCTEKDREQLPSILEALSAAGVRVFQDRAAGKDDIVLAVLSESFYADGEKTKALLDLVGAGAGNVLPLQLDSAPIPDTLKNALYARNIIPAAGRDAAQIAQRITAAIPPSPPVLPKLLIAGAAVLAAAVGLLLWRASPQPETVPVMAEETPEPLVLPFGLTEEDLAQIVDVVIVGEQAELYTKTDVGTGPLPDWDHFAYRDFDRDGPHWFSREDGHEYTLTRYEDLRFLELLPNLRSLTLAKVEAGQLPNLAGLKRLEHLMLMDSVIPDLEWLRGASFNNGSINDTGSITDFSPLTSCEKLRHINLDLYGNTQADFSGFAPPALDTLQIVSGQNLRAAPDLSALSGCPKLRECQLERLTITDLSFLSDAAALETLRLESLSSLRDISALGSLPRLKDLEIRDCDRIGDFQVIGLCQALQTFFYRTEENLVFRDASFLAGLPQLNNISLQNVDLPNVDFLRGIAEHQSSLQLDLTGNYGDYSGLDAIKSYRRLVLDPGDGTPLTEILPYLAEAKIQDLALRRFAVVDLSALPRPSSRLELDRCGIEDLRTLPEDWKIPHLNLNKCSSLRSLDGLQYQTGIHDLEIYYCPRLTDWSALEGMQLNSLSITGGYTVPEGIDYHASFLRIDSVEELEDLHFLDAMSAEKLCSFTLVGLDADNLEPLRRFHGIYLAVPPQLQEQAEDLVKAGNFDEYKIEYPQGGWEEDTMALTLLSLDELDTLPPALLRRVERVCLVGDTLVDISRGDVWVDWSNGRPTLVMHSWGGEETPLSCGPGFADVLEKLSKLSGLKELRLYRQPIHTLDGIQSFPQLEEIQIVLCDELRDASALFACPNLRFIRIDNCPITSIQGVQNLRELSELNINGTQVSDLSPLADADFSVAREQGGLNLFVNNLPVEDYSPLDGLPLNRLDINDADAEDYLPYVEGAPLRSFQACNSFAGRTSGDDNTLFASFVRSHPLLEEINIAWNQGITDLKPLLELSALREVRVSRDMEEALASLNGTSYAFALEIDG